MENENFWDFLAELLKIEQEEDRKQYQQKMHRRSLQDRVKQGFTWYPLGLERMYIGTGERIILELSRTYTSEGQAIQPGDAVVVYGMLSGQETGSASGVVMRVRKNSMKVMLSIEYTPDWVHHGTLGVNLDFDERTYREMRHTLAQLKSPIRSSRIWELREILAGKTPAGFRKWDFQYKNPALNASQVEAIQHICQARDLAIVHGPPGTGKTTTLIHAIVETLLHENQVLVCAPSNTAVDLLTLRCHEQGISVVRLGNPARVEEELHKLTLDGAIREHPDYAALRKLRKDVQGLNKQALKFKKRFGYEQKQRRQDLLREAREMKALAHKLEDYILHQVLDRTQVIACTLVGAAHSVLGKKRFHTVFIDEAAQALEPACWIPILRANRVVLAGDHYQLPPTVKSTEAAARGLAKTLFERVIEEKPEAAKMLEYQYRMNEKIMNFSGAQFYQHRLKAVPEVAHHTLGAEFSPLEFIDTAGCGFDEKRNSETQSLYNAEEAQLLLRHLALLCNRLENLEPSVWESRYRVGIISPYKEQVAYLKQSISNSPMLSAMQNLTVNTIDGFQGQEKDIIYISLVRSNAKGEIGFLKDRRRMNVALTRARKKLVVIGDSATLGKHPFYEAFLTYVESEQAYHSAWDFAYSDS